jgi:hypothetical protein
VKNRQNSPQRRGERREKIRGVKTFAKGSGNKEFFDSFSFCISLEILSKRVLATFSNF